MFLFVVPVQHIKLNWKILPLFMVFPIIGIIWKLLGPGNVGYSISSSMIIDMAMIVYCFYWNAKLIDAIPIGGDMRWIRKLSLS